jgi:hypothetical protein
MDPVNAGGFITPQWLAYSEVIAIHCCWSLQEAQQLAGAAQCAAASRNTASGSLLQQYSKRHGLPVGDFTVWLAAMKQQTGGTGSLRSSRTPAISAACGRQQMLVFWQEQQQLVASSQLCSMVLQARRSHKMAAEQQQLAGPVLDAGSATQLQPRTMLTAANLSHLKQQCSGS